MQKLSAVEDAKALMREATEWSMWGWLTGKPRLRSTADAAWEALEGLERKVKSGWSDELKKAYRGRDGRGLDAELEVAVRRMKQADEAWRTARDTAELTFDEAEQRVSTSLAREGAQQAIEAWELTERAIRRAEALARRSSAHKE
jgi:hypothetical protein